MASSALFYGTKTDNIGQTIIASLVSTVVMAPVNVVFPRMFMLINSYKSETLVQVTRREVKELREKKDRYMQVRRRGVTAAFSRATALNVRLLLASAARP